MKRMVAKFMRQARRKHEAVCTITQDIAYDNAAEEQVRGVQAHFEFDVRCEIAELGGAVCFAIAVVAVEPDSLLRLVVLEGVQIGGTDLGLGTHHEKRH